MVNSRNADFQVAKFQAKTDCLENKVRYPESEECMLECKKSGIIRAEEGVASSSRPWQDETGQLQDKQVPRRCEGRRFKKHQSKRRATHIGNEKRCHGEG